MKHFILSALLFLFSLTLLTGCAGSEERAWQSGQKALAEEKYSDAAAAFEKAGVFQDSDRLLLYSSAWVALGNNDFSGAETAFQSLGNFKDSSLMVSYCRAREREADAAAGFSSENADHFISALREAYVLYSSLPCFRDCDTRAASCRDQIFFEASEWMNQSRYNEAAAGFAVLGNWKDSDKLQAYCEASRLEQQGSFVEAADLFSSIVGIMDAETRASGARECAYQTAEKLKADGNYEGASKAFSELGDYKDSETQKEECTAFLIRTLLQTGSYAEALQKYHLLTLRDSFPTVDINEAGNLDAFLDSFINVWLNAHAGVMNVFFSCNLLQPFLESGGELDVLLRDELKDVEAPLNYGFVYYGKQLEDLRMLYAGYTVVQAHASASVITSDGLTEIDETLLILIDSTRANPLVAAVLRV